MLGGVYVSDIPLLKRISNKAARMTREESIEYLKTQERQYKSRLEFRIAEWCKRLRLEIEKG